VLGLRDVFCGMTSRGGITWKAPAQVDAMVLSGCRMCGSLTYEYIHLEGGTHRLFGRTKGRKEAESKANSPGN
jgi:hypothetical protein